MDTSSPRRSRLFAGLFAALLATTGIAAGAAAPASAAPARSSSAVLEYVALGDSFAAGQGGGRSLDSCKHTRLSYPELLDIPRTVRLTADPTCAGATTADVLNIQLPAAAAKLPTAKLVTLTVGGNDLGVVDIAAVCTAAPSSQQCAALVAQVPARLAGVGTGVAGILGALDAVAPRAKILVTGYPRLFEPVPSTHPNFALITQVNAATDALNQTIRGVVDAARTNGVDARYVDVAGIFSGHGIGARFPWIHASGNDVFHPNVVGHTAYALAVGRALLR